MGKKVTYKMGEMDLVEMVEKVADKKGKEAGQWPLKGWEVVDYGRNGIGGHWFMFLGKYGRNEEGGWSLRG